MLINYQKSAEDIMQEYQTTIRGLSEEEVLEKRQYYGENKLEEPQNKPRLLIF